MMLFLYNLHNDLTFNLVNLSDGPFWPDRYHTCDVVCIFYIMTWPLTLLTFQTDLFGLIGTIHVMLFATYMRVYREAGHWKTTSAFKR